MVDLFEQFDQDVGLGGRQMLGIDQGEPLVATEQRAGLQHRDHRFEFVPNGPDRTLALATGGHVQPDDVVGVHAHPVEEGVGGVDHLLTLPRPRPGGSCHMLYRHVTRLRRSGDENLVRISRADGRRAAHGHRPSRRRAP